MKKQFTAVIKQDSGWWIGWVEEIPGVNSQGKTKAELKRNLRSALTEAAGHPGLSLVHVPVYYGPDPLGGLGAYGVWNVGNWCEDVQARYHTQNI